MKNIGRFGRRLGINTILAGFMLIAAFAAIFKVLFIYRPSLITAPLQPSPFNQATSTPTSTVGSKQTDSTLNWKMYVNMRFGFSFRYPADWLVQENDQEYATWDQVVNIFSSSDTKTPSDVQGSIYIWKQSVNNKPIDLSTLQTNFKFKKPEAHQQIHELSIAGYKAYRYRDYGDNSTSVSLVFEKDRRVFQIGFAILTNQYNQANIYSVEQLLNSVSLR